ncbi:MAG TPA: AAA family ATPase [Candidatus Limnocylindria bacterium]|nr:AAA family ATPase [Candidatus Limnocylindria bacterium]
MAVMLRTVIIDSDAESRALLRKTLATTPSVVVVSEYAEIRQAAVDLPGRRPDLVIVELPGDVADRAIQAIHEVAEMVPDAAIFATGQATSAEFVIQVIRAGAAEFLSRPVERDDVLTALDKLSRGRRAPTAPRMSGRIISVFATKGGLGATTLATNLAVCLAGKRPDRTLLVDFDTRQSDVRTLLSVRSPYSVLDALENLERMDDAYLRGLLTRHESGLMVLPGPAKIERTAPSTEQIQAALEILRSHFVHVVADLRHDFDLGTLATLEVSDTVLFLTGPTVSGIRSAAAGIAAFRSFGLNLNKVKVVLMREDTGGDVTLKHVREALGVPVFWKTPSDYQAVVSAINTGEPVVTASPRSKVSKNLRELADLLATASKAGVEHAEKPMSLLGRLVWSPRVSTGA